MFIFFEDRIRRVASLCMNHYKQQQLELNQRMEEFGGKVENLCLIFNAAEFDDLFKSICCNFYLQR
jgi:hypothetical protein